MSDFTTYLDQASQAPLSENDMTACITLLMRGTVPDQDAAAFLTALHTRGETADEIAGAARALRSMATTIDAPKGAIDCCGTGGDGLKTYNISTAVALIAAACGVPIAKHGNRSATSQTGAADILEKIGINLSLDKATLESALKTLNFCFLMAPHHHAAMKNVASVRKSLPHRTIFNLLGPLANPAGTKKQLIGVFDQKWLEPMASALQSLGSDQAMIVHGSDGLDEITLTGETHIALLKNGTITRVTLLPQDFGLETIALDDIRGGDADHNAAALMDLLNGKHSAYRSIVLANAAAVLQLHDDRPLKDGVLAAANAIDMGRALNVLEQYKEIKQ